MNREFMLDYSDSMLRNPQIKTIESLKSTMDTIQQQDRLEVIRFSDGDWIKQDFTEDKELLKTKTDYGDILTTATGHLSYEEPKEMMIEVAGKMLNIVGSDVKLETTAYPQGTSYTISITSPYKYEVIDNRDHSKTLKWNLDKIIMGEEKDIKLLYQFDNNKSDTEVSLTEDTKLTYLDKNNDLVEIELEGLKIPVKPYNIDTKINTDKKTYKSNEEVEITIDAKSLTKNLTENEIGFIAQIDITDENGNIVTTVSKEEIKLIVNENKKLKYNWNTRKYIKGKYNIEVTWLTEEKEVSKAQKTFEIINDKSLENKVTTDKIEYNSNEIVEITDRINNPSINSIETGLKVKNTIINNLDEEIWANETDLKELLPNDSTSTISSWNTEKNLPGEYMVISRIYKGEELISEASNKFKILDSKEAEKVTGVIGEMGSIKRSIYPSDEIDLTYKITNTGNSNIENIEQRIRIIDPETKEIIETISETTSLKIGEVRESNKTWSHEPLKTGNYLVVYDGVLENGTEIPLYSQGFIVKKPEIIKPKVITGAIFINKEGKGNSLQIPLISQIQGNASIYTGMSKYDDRVPIEINDGEISELFASLNDRGSRGIEILNDQIKEAKRGGKYKLEIKDPTTGDIDGSNRIKKEHLTRVDKDSEPIELNYEFTKENVIDYFSVGQELERIFMLPINSELEYEQYINGEKLFPSIYKPTNIVITDDISLEKSLINSREDIDLRGHQGISTNKRLKITENGELTLNTAPNTVMYLDSGIEISQGGKLIIEANGRLDIYVSQGAQIDGNVFVNKGVGEVNIYVLGRNDFQANNRAQIVGINLYAPDSEVQLGNYVEFEGVIVCNHLQFNDTAKFRVQ